MQNAALTETIIGCAIKVHKTLGPGFLESVYEKALAHELSKAGLQVECQRPVKVTYDGIVVGDFVVDMLVSGAVLVENKGSIPYLSFMGASDGFPAYWLKSLS